VARAQSWAAVRQVPVISTADGLTTPGGISEEAAALERERLLAQAAAERVPTQAEVQAVLFAAPAARAEPGLGELGYTSDQDIMLGSYPYHYRKAQQFQQRQQYDRAAEEYERALAADPTRLEPRLDLGDMMMRLERYPRARIYFERAMEDFPDSPRPCLKMGNYYLAINQPERARDYFRLATEKDPLYAEAYNNLAVMAMRDKNYTEAARLLDELLKLDPNYANAYFNRGIIASDVEKDTTLALSLFRKYIDLGGARAAEVQGWITELENPER
jgi:tetratricopeptide (TPR) repeat protein